MIVMVLERSLEGLCLDSGDGCAEGTGFLKEVMLKLTLEAYMLEEVRELSGVSCIRELIPLMRAPPS